MFSWPVEMLAALQSEDKAKEVLGRFKDDVHAFSAFRDKGGHSASERELLRRHPMNMRVNKQYQAALSESDYRMSPDFQQLLRSHIRINV